VSHANSTPHPTEGRQTWIRDAFLVCIRARPSRVRYDW
jgi:hypothetical protein